MPDITPEHSPEGSWAGIPGTGIPVRVLVIEDDGNDQALLKFAATRSGLNLRLHTAQTVRDGIAFLEKPGAGSLPADLVLLDLFMPGDSGFDFLRWWAKSPWRCIPVAVLSGSTYPPEQSAAVAMGATRFLAKPTTLDQWEQTVREVWALAQQRSFRVGMTE